METCNQQHSDGSADRIPGGHEKQQYKQLNDAFGGRQMLALLPTQISWNWLAYMYMYVEDDLEK